MKHIIKTDKIDKETLYGDSDKLLSALEERNFNRLYIKQQCQYLLPCGWCDKHNRVCTQVGV